MNCNIILNKIEFLIIIFVTLIISILSYSINFKLKEVFSISKLNSCESNIEMLSRVILNFKEEYKKYPNSLIDLHKRNTVWLEEEICCLYSRLTYLYFKQNYEDLNINTSKIILSCPKPHIVKGEKIRVVIFSDERLEVIKEDKFNKIRK